MATWADRRGESSWGDGRNCVAGVAMNPRLSGRALLQAGESCTIRLDKHWHDAESAAVGRSLPRAGRASRAGGVIVL